METAALWERRKNKVRFSSVPTALGKLDQERRVSHSYHSPLRLDIDQNKRHEKPEQKRDC